MTNRKLIIGEKHHWWPETLAKSWQDTSGFITRIAPDESSQPIAPKKLAKIGDAHNIIIGNGSTWGCTFEHDFDAVDGTFAEIIKRLTAITSIHRATYQESNNIYVSHDPGPAFLDSLTRSIVSLVVRSPLFRYREADFHKWLRQTGLVKQPLDKKEEKLLIAANLIGEQQRISECISASGKFVVFFSQSSEFIFGDGFYHNIQPKQSHFHDIRILVPLTPCIAVLFARPFEYLLNPRFMTRRADTDLVALINDTVQVYSKDYLFYRSECPSLSEAFRAAEHLEYLPNHDPINRVIRSVPGVLHVLGNPLDTPP